MGLVQRAVELARHRYRGWQEERLDRKYGIDTRGVVDDLAALGARGESLTHAYGYEPVQPAMFRTILHAACVDPGEYAFVDFGSGKGRALVLAAECGFRRVIGVELAPALHEAALRNVAAYRKRRPDAPAIALCCGDAAAFPIPAEPLFACLYNPFGEVVLRRVLSNIERAWRERPRPVVIAYRNPLHAAVLDEFAAFRRFASNRSFALYRTHE